jgi:hypothetical protein
MLGVEGIAVPSASTPGELIVSVGREPVSQLLAPNASVLSSAAAAANTFVSIGGELRQLQDWQRAAAV